MGPVSLSQINLNPRLKLISSGASTLTLQLNLKQDLSQECPTVSFNLNLKCFNLNLSVLMLRWPGVTLLT